VVILALAGVGYAAYKMKKSPENKSSMIVFMALGLAIAWLTTAVEIRRSETEKRGIEFKTTSLNKPENFMSEETEIPEEVKQQYYSIRIYQKEAAGKKNYLETEKIKLEDGRYGSKVTLKSEGTNSSHSMHLDCTTNSGNKIVDAEIEMNEEPKSLLQYYVYPRISTDHTETVEVSIAWLAEFEKIRPTEFKLLIITEADPVNIECRYEEMAYDY